ncbi:MAG: hypothetical protein AAFV93_09040 [Chloroflexota bacterium]
MPDNTLFTHEKTLELPHHGQAHILGLLPDGMLYVEEFYDDAFLAQHRIATDATILQTQDENDGTQVPNWFSLPSNCILPNHPTEHPLNKKAVRLRGMRETDRVSEWAQPLTIMEKMPLIQQLGLTLPAMMLLGIAESHVLAQATIAEKYCLVCRRIQIVYTLPKIQYDTYGMPFDYDCLTLHLLHDYVADDTRPLHELLTTFAPVERPLDCLFHKGTLYVTEGGTETISAKVHWFTHSPSVLSD